MGIIKFNGISSNDLGLIVQFIPTYKYPEREYESVTIPGRNGSLLVDKGRYENTERTYSLAKIYRPGENFVSSANQIVEWLSSAEGYARLEDSYEPEYYREALYKSDGEMANYYDTATAIDVTFDCKPQRWLIEGEKPQSIAINNNTHIGSIYLTNPTKFPAKPIIKFKTIANQDAVIEVLSESSTVLYTLTYARETASNDITIDCDLMECFTSTSFKNSNLTLSNSFPVINGKQKVQIRATNVTECEIIPRWWTL